MRCDLHVHTIHSGKCTVPGLSRVCMESYNEPRALYDTLKRRGMDLVTVTDHDSIDAAEELAARFAGQHGMPVTAGSDSHTLHGVGRTFTEIAGVHSAAEYMTALRRGQGVPHGESGNCWKLTQAISSIGWSMVRANRRTAVLSPLFALVPLFALANYVHEQAFAWYWGQKSRTVEPDGKLLSLRAVEL